MRNRPNPPAFFESPWAAATRPRLQTAGRPRTLRTRPKLPPARCRHHAEFGKLSPSPGRCVSGASAAVPPAQRVAVGVPPAGEAQRGPAACAGARAQRGRRLGGGGVGAARRRRKPFQHPPPRLLRRASSAPEATVFAGADCVPDPRPECERAVGFGRHKRARSGGRHIFERGHAVFRLSGALSGWPGQPEPRQTAQNRRAIAAALGAAVTVPRGERGTGPPPVCGKLGR